MEKGDKLCWTGKQMIEDLNFVYGEIFAVYLCHVLVGLESQYPVPAPGGVGLGGSTLN